jgi:hypothetical protein
VISGDAQAAETLAREHISQASETLVSRLADRASVELDTEKPARRISRRSGAAREAVVK